MSHYYALLIMINNDCWTAISSRDVVTTHKSQMSLMHHHIYFLIFFSNTSSSSIVRIAESIENAIFTHKSSNIYPAIGWPYRIHPSPYGQKLFKCGESLITKLYVYLCCLEENAYDTLVCGCQVACRTHQCSPI